MLWSYSQCSLNRGKHSWIFLLSHKLINLFYFTTAKEQASARADVKTRLSCLFCWVRASMLFITIGQSLGLVVESYVVLELSIQNAFSQHKLASTIWSQLTKFFLKVLTFSPFNFFCIQYKPLKVNFVWNINV